MPELPEVEALRSFLAERCTGRAIVGAELATFSALKTFDPPLEALAGTFIEQVQRRGKYLALGGPGLWLVFYLARAGWVQWRDQMPEQVARPGKGPLAFRLRLSDGSGFDLTEAGTQKHLALYLVADPEQIPRVASLGPDPLAAGFTTEVLGQILQQAGRAQIKGVLKDQSIIAGIGNAYSDEICWAARLSPFAPANGVDVEVLHRAITTTLTDAVAQASGRPARELKDAKRAHLVVHGQQGNPCPVCGSTIASVDFADSSLQYCPGCQTGGKLLADRRMSRLLK